MPKASRSAADEEVAGLTWRSDPRADSFRPMFTGRPSSSASRVTPTRGVARPKAGRLEYGSLPVPAYVAYSQGHFSGVVTSKMRGSTDLHSFFVCSHDGRDYLFNPNDYSGWRNELPADGSQLVKYHEHIRPMMRRDEQIELTWNPERGECCEFAQHLSQFWYHPSHAGSNLQQRRILMEHMIAVCCGVRSTREFAEKLWTLS